MLRHSLTYLRSQGLSTLLPLDHHIYLHKLTGIVISVLSLVHTIMHLFNFSIIIVNDEKINAGHYTISEWLLTDRPGLFGLIPGCANPTGVALFLILLIMFICSQPFVRRKGSFEVFYWTHLLYIPFWILVLFHGPNFWKWFLIPGLVYIIERILRFVWMRSEHGKSYISSGLLLPSKVIHLVIKRPFNFNFRPGDYVFVNIPAIANYEWHPFTISSAPEQEDYMWLHIRTVGEWTNRLYRYFEKEQEKLHKGEIPPHFTDPVQVGFTRINEIQSGSISTATSSLTPQTDFLAKNLSKMHHRSSFDSAITNKTLANMSQKQQQQKITPIRPPRHNNAITSKLATQSVSAHETATAPAPPTSSNSHSDRIRNLKQTLQRTFSRKDNTQSNNKQQLSSVGGITNDGFINDISDLKGKPVQHSKNTADKKNRQIHSGRVPLEKSLSLPDMAVKTKKRERMKV